MLSAGVVAVGTRADARGRRLALGAAALGGLMVASTVLRTAALDTSLWTDEGISAGIASHPATDIPGLLRQDGSPPLYYLLLHGWMKVAGTGEVALRLPSLLFALALVPAALWAGRTLFGARAGWIAAVIAASSSFITAYAQEARMYTLVALLGLVATAALVRGLGRRDLRWTGAFAAALTLLLYTHGWAVFFAAGALCAALGLRPRPRDLALGFGLPALAFAPWVSTLLFQAQHTGAPWANPPSPLVLLEAAGLALAGLLGARLGEREDQRRASIALGALAATALALAWLGAQLQPMWADRYLAIVAGPVLLLGGFVLARCGRAGVAAVVGLAVLWGLEAAPEPKSNVAAATAAVEGHLRPGDLVLATQPELVPVLAHHLPAGLGWADALGTVADPRVVDWRDAVTRLGRAQPSAASRRLVGAMEPGSRLLLVRPHVDDRRRWRAPWTRLVARRSAQWAAALERDQRLRRIARVPGPRRPTARTSVTAVLYQRTGG